MVQPESSPTGNTSNTRLDTQGRRNDRSPTDHMSHTRRIPYYCYYTIDADCHENQVTSDNATRSPKRTKHEVYECPSTPKTRIWKHSELRVDELPTGTLLLPSSVHKPGSENTAAETAPSISTILIPDWPEITIENIEDDGMEVRERDNNES